MALTQILIPAAGIATALATWRKPSEAAGVLLMVAPIVWAGGAASADDMSGQASSGVNLPVVVCGVATLMYGRLLLRPQALAPFEWLRTAAIGYCLAILPAVFMAESFMRALGGYVRLISPIVFMFALLQPSRDRGISSFQFKAMALAPLSFLAVVVAAHFSGEDSYLMGGFERLRAFHLSPQHVALYSVVASGVLVCGMALDKHRWRYATVWAMLMVCAYLTGYRTAWIGIFVLLGIVVLLVLHSRYRKWAIALMAIAAVIQSGAIVQSFARYAQVNRGLSLSMLDSITSGRITVDRIAIDAYVAGGPADWVFGIGPYSSEAITGRLLGTAYIIHSDYLATVIECGIVGLVAYAFLLFTIARILLFYRRSLPQDNQARMFVTIAWALFVAFAGMGIASALYTNVFIGWYYYAFIGLALAQAKAYNLQVLSSAGKVVTREAAMAYAVPAHPGYVSKSN